MRRDASRFMKGIDTRKRILEIGPFYSPIFTKAEADVYYADICNDSEILQKFKNEPCVKKAVSIDYVIKESYTADLKNVPPFDYVISCHVLEHIPRIIDFFLDIQNVMSPGGLFYAMLPDHRYCFDHFRQPTSFAEAWHVHVSKIPCAPWRVLEHVMDTTSCNDSTIFWKDDSLAVTNLLSNVKEWKRFVEAYEKTVGGAVTDVHFSVFTPKTFLYFTYNMIRAGVFPWQYKSFCFTPYRDFTFSFSLAACPAMVSDLEIARHEMTKIAALMDEDEKLLNGKTIQWF